MKHLYVLLALFAMQILSAQKLSSISYSDNGKPLSGKTIKTNKKNIPGVLILPAWMGIDSEAEQAAVNLNNQGYKTFIADIYGVGNEPKDAKQAKELSSYYKTNPEIYQQRIQLALNELIKQGADPNKIAVIGYCFGGTGALETARGILPVQGVVSIHGNLGKGDRANGPIKTKVLVLNGAADASVSKQEILNFEQEMDQAEADWQFINYANCKHTFTNPASPDYNKIMADRSWQHILLFLDEVLRN
ncbi:dienelactone hydrolase family protein [Flavobacterium agricola]|uniref:Dienelactone hydrolase family protein n=1 Tax=Flavobacterium agricola TaxID=2870839 RepID=A0ABY6M0Y2_9FLAO|nr:dienelactone hydrolase family protein [Flavobacterium agricola]UYW02212.1 dienelactone hydrolase family protein [Flavobacterium agricola]